MQIDLKKSDFDLTIAPWLGKSSKMMNMYIADVFKKNAIPISKQQWIVLKLLFNKPEGIVQNELAFITERNKASLTRLIKGMENNKLVSRIQSQEDFRKNIVFITKKGSELFIKTEPLILNSVLKIQEGITENEMKNFIITMSKIQNNLKNHSI